MSDTSVRDLFISSVKKYAADGLSDAPLGDWYETTNGGPEGFRARPVVGGHLALVSQLLYDLIATSRIHYTHGQIACRVSF